MDKIMNLLNYALDSSSQQIKLYGETGDKKHLDSCEVYLRAANIFMKEILNENCHR